MYETFGISKRLPIKLSILLICSEVLDKLLIFKCFYCDVMSMCFVSCTCLKCS